MEFIILRDVDVAFTGHSTSSAPGSITRISPALEAEILQTKDEDDSTDNEMFSTQLQSILLENVWIYKQKDTKTDWNLRIEVSLPDPTQIGTDGAEDGKLKVYSKLDDTLDPDGFLKILHNYFNITGGNSRNVTVNVVVKNFGLRLEEESSDNPSPISWRAEGLVLEEIFENNERITECVYDFQLPNPMERMLLAWKNDQEFSGIFTISVVFSSLALSLLDSINPIPQGRFRLLKRMLKYELFTDLEILTGVSPDERFIKCHRAVLAAASVVFQRMFESGMKEATGNVIEIEEMTENGVRALIAYLYCRDVTAAYESCDIALELLQAGEKYQIGGLKHTIRYYMMAKESSWFGVDMVLTLYLYVKALCPGEEDEIKDVEETRKEDKDVELNLNRDDQNENADDENAKEVQAWKSLKIKCLKVLKWYIKKKPRTLLESVKYREIYGGGNLELGMEISSGIVRLE